ncbi:copper homeostasis protein CutC [Vibrio sp. MA40-2]|uniref:copper homeostasis protein CutC n=1 Tax=Vibrio sp. MA40-2 TaxID=3391828 RepID=UPI0039A5217B
MSYQIEVCIDNLESMHNAITGGATRIELCSALALGGLTPSFGFMQKAAQLSTVPIYAMIRPRQGDFLYDSDDIEAMLQDIYVAKQAGLQGVVFGVLNKFAEIDMDSCDQLMKAATGLDVTFHRAIDQCADYQLAIENIIRLGCKRILTSGLAANAYEGREVIASMVKQANGQLAIMAGAGVSAANVADIIKVTGVKNLHLSGKSSRISRMHTVSNQVKMGSDQINDNLIPITDPKKIQAIIDAIKAMK